MADSISTHADSDAKAYSAIRNLLNGGPPDGIAPEACGRWAEHVQALYEAHGTGGIESVRRAFDVLARQEPALAELIAGNSATGDAFSGLNIITAADLERMDLPEPEYIIDGVLPEGSTVLAAKPKRGKSMLMQQIGVAIACGGKALGKVDVDQGRVLYLMLEGSLRGLKRRISAMLQGEPFPTNLHIVKRWPSVQDGGVDLLYQWIEKYSDTRLIIIDTLKLIRGKTDSRRNIYDTDYEALHPFSELYEETGVSSVIIHHANKRASDDDVVDQVSGSTGLSGAVENVMVLVREGRQMILKVRPREEEEMDLAVDFNPVLKSFTLQGDAALVAKTEERQNILDVLLKADGPMRPTDIAAITEQKPNNVTQLLFKMKDEGKVMQPKYGFYAITDKTGKSDKTTGEGQ